MTLTRTFRNGTFILLVIEFLLIFVPLTILGAAINWPASLGEPASVNLPLILEQATAVKLGYSIYMVYSILIIPVAVVIARTVGGAEQDNLLLRIGVGFAIGSAVLRVLGIIRWLIPMPVLAHIYVDPATSAVTQEAVAAMYDMLNAYAGTVGEVLGVGLFSALWVATTSYVILRKGTLPRWLGIYGLLVSVALSVGLLEIIDVDTGPFLPVNGMMLHFWWLFIALIVMFRPQWIRAGRA